MNRKKYRKKLVLKPSIKKSINRLLITILIVLVTLIAIKKKPELKKYISENIYQKSFKFTKIKSIYEKYFGSFIPIDKIIKEEKPVFNEKLTYKKSNSYKDGVALSVDKKYMVPALESGIVVFIGEKEDYGTTVIIDQIDGVEVYYSNITVENLKLYDYVEKGKLIGEAKTDKIYLVFSKDGKYLDYKNYI